MITQSTNSKWQNGLLVALRITIGWHLLYEGFTKLSHPEWSSIGFLAESKWIFSGIAEWIISKQQVLNTVDFLNTFGLLAIGLGLILGLFTRWAAISGTALLLLYYLFLPPFIGMDSYLLQEGNYLLVNKNLIEALMLLLIATAPQAKNFGLDSIILSRK